jgi:hypothetical protein
MGDQNPMAYVHKGGVRILSYLIVLCCGLAVLASGLKNNTCFWGYGLAQLDVQSVYVEQQAADLEAVVRHSFIHSCYTCGRSSYKQRGMLMFLSEWFAKDVHPLHTYVKAWLGWTTDCLLLICHKSSIPCFLLVLT